MFACSFRVPMYEPHFLLFTKFNLAQVTFNAHLYVRKDIMFSHLFHSHTSHRLIYSHNVMLLTFFIPKFCGFSRSLLPFSLSSSLSLSCKLPYAFLSVPSMIVLPFYLLLLNGSKKNSDHPSPFDHGIPNSFLLLHH